jgi:hypothetical protein
VSWQTRSQWEFGDKPAMTITTKQQWTDEMQSLAAVVQSSIRMGVMAGLTQEAAGMAAMIGVINHLRVEGVDEDRVIREAKRACTGK